MEATLKRKPGIRFELDIWSQSLAFPQARRNRIGSASYSVLLSCHGFASKCVSVTVQPASPQKQSPKTKLLMTEYFCLYPWSNYKVSARSRHERWRWRLTREAKASLKEEPLGIKLWPVEGGHLAMYSFLSPCQITFVHVPRLFRTHRFFFVDTWIILGMWSDWTMVLLPVFPSWSPNFFLQIQRFFLTWCHFRAEVRFVGYDPWLFGACHSRGQLDIL